MEEKPLFKKRVYDVVRHIPRGCVATYKEVAEAAGYSGAYRAVGAVLSQNTDPAVPCHRVIRSDGKLGGYNRGLRQKKLRLEQEGALR
jgi:methylated-DNA-[protein]-cysteine S-methyltransferase